jgi:hypothetical protein
MAISNLAAASVQRSLSDALRYFLYSSFSNSLRGRFSLGWRRLDPGPLRRTVKCFSDLDTGNGEFQQLTGSLHDTWMSEIAFARGLAAAHRRWADILEQEARIEGGITPVPASKSYQSWWEGGGRDERYRAAHRLRAHLSSKSMNALFARAVIHGSVATLDDTLGFSDLDLALVIRRAALVDHEALIELRRRAAELLVRTYEFDPFMHHCPYYLSEIDLGWYPEAMFPLVLFEYAVDLIDRPESLLCSTRASDDITDEMLDMFERWFQDRVADPEPLRSHYDVEWTLGNAMLLPALYLQRRTGRFRYKRDTFQLAQVDFSHEEWEPIRQASEVRMALEPRIPPPPIIVRLALLLRSPSLVQRWAIRQPRSRQAARNASRELGADFPQRVVRLLNSMRAKLNVASPRSVVDFKAADIEGATGSSFGKPSIAQYFEDFVDGPFSELPIPINRERYDVAIELLLNRWLSVSQRPLAVYQLGQIGAPGISDLDFVVVVPTGQRVNWTDYQPQSFPAWVREIFTHPPYFCDPTAWSCMPAWFPVFDLRFLWGEQLPAPTIPQSAKTGCALGELIDYLLVKLPRDILFLAWSRPLRVATLLCVMHSFKYSLRLAEQAGIAPWKEAVDTIAAVDRLRGDWFGLAERERIELLGRLCAELCGIIGTLMARVDGCISGSGGTRLDTDSPRRPTSEDNGLFRFKPDWTFDASIKNASERFTGTGSFAWSCPLSFAQVLSVYADETPILRGHLQSLGCPMQSTWQAGVWDEGLRFHARAMTTYSNSARLIGVPAQQYIALGL